MAQTIKAKDTIHGAQGECFATIDGNRYNLMHVTKIEAKTEKTKTEVPILGQVNKGNKPGALKNTGSATFHYGTPIFLSMLDRYQKTGEDLYFDIQVTNEDKTSGAGRQTVILRDCNINGGVIALLDTGTDDLTQDLDFTFESFDVPEAFNIPDGMEA